MEFRFNETKAAQAAAYLLRKRGGLTYGQILKLLFLADRKKLLERGTPITGDRVASMDHGLLLSILLNVIRYGKAGPYGEEWHRYVSRPGGDNELDICAIRDDTDDLSKYELGILDEVDAKYGHLTFTQLRTLTHALPEYRDPSGSSEIIDPEQILEAEGQPTDRIADAEEKADAMLALARLNR